MNVDLYTSSGTKKGSLELPSSLFEAPINKGLMHLAIVRQQSNRRLAIAHVKHRGEIAGTTKKAFQQKGTGQARRGALRSPLLRGGGKSFGPRSEANFTKQMPKKMRRAALLSCLSQRAKDGVIIGLESFDASVPKTKELMSLLKKLPVAIGRRILFVLPGAQKSFELSARNVPRVKTLYAQYLNPEDILLANSIIIVGNAATVAEGIFSKKDAQVSVGGDSMTEEKGEKKVTKKAKTVTKKKPSSSKQ